MALENLSSAYGPANKKGEQGTGSPYRPITQGVSKLTGTRSKLGTPEKLGAIPKGPDVFGGPESIPGMVSDYK